MYLSEPFRLKRTNSTELQIEISSEIVSMYIENHYIYIKDKIFKSLIVKINS